MGYIIAHGPCARCGNVIGFNPEVVPSVGFRPLCKPCVEWVNEERAKMTPPMEAVWIPDNAYEPLEVG